MIITTSAWFTFGLAAIKSLPELITLMTRIKASADARVARGQGYDQAVADGLKLATEQLELADGAVAEAHDRQAAHPGDDAGRDISFRRD